MTVLDETPVLAAIRELLRARGVAFEERRHAPTFTSEEAAAARGEPLEIGAKAIVAKVGAEFRLFVLSAARGVSSRRICKHLGETRFRFADREELEARTGLVPGCVPPFGPPILDLPLYVDRSIEERERVAFNAGSHTHSMLLSSDDYLRVARPLQVFAFSR